SLVQVGKYPITTGQDSGFFTTVSCNTSTPYGSCAKGSAIIWAVSRPKPMPANNESTAVNLYAFSSLPGATPGVLKLLFGPVPAGSWPTLSANANIVPTVSNGKVYVASAFQDPTGVLCPVVNGVPNTCGQLNIFGICPPTGCISAPVATSPIAS